MKNQHPVSTSLEKRKDYYHLHLFLFCLESAYHPYEKQMCKSDSECLSSNYITLVSPWVFLGSIQNLASEVRRIYFTSGSVALTKGSATQRESMANLRVPVKEVKTGNPSIPTLYLSGLLVPSALFCLPFSFSTG